MESLWTEKSRRGRRRYEKRGSAEAKRFDGLGQTGVTKNWPTAGPSSAKRRPRSGWHHH